MICRKTSAENILEKCIAHSSCFTTYHRDVKIVTEILSTIIEHSWFSNYSSILSAFSEAFHFFLPIGHSSKVVIANSRFQEHVILLKVSTFTCLSTQTILAENKHKKQIWTTNMLISMHHEPVLANIIINHGFEWVKRLYIDLLSSHCTIYSPRFSWQGPWVRGWVG